MTFPFRSSLPFCFLLHDRLISAIFLRPLFFSSVLLLIDRLFFRPLLNFVAPWPPFLPPGLGCTLRGQAAVSSRSCRLLRLYRLGYGLRRSGSNFSDGPLSSRLPRVSLAFLDHSHCRLRGRYMHRFLDRSFSRFLDRFVCRLPGRSVCRPLGPLRVPPSGPLTVPPPRPLPVPPAWPLGVPPPTQLGRPAPAPRSVPQASPLFEPPPSLLIVAYLTAPCAASSTASRTVLRGTY